MKIFFKGFNFSQDGPGNRLVYHLQGCNMKCPWCSNPEGMPFCGGKEVSAEEIVKECMSCKTMFFSGGGVTFTGGEATIQHEELAEVLALLKKAEIHTAIETNGTSVHLKEIQEHVDYLIMDFKHFDKDAFLSQTGVAIAPLLDNFEFLQSIERQLHIRIPLINHFNADDPLGFAKYFSKFENKNCLYEFLPYHEYGKAKWKSEYKITDGFVSDKQLSDFIKTFKEYGLKVTNT